MPEGKRFHVAFFVGSDITSNLLASRMARQLIGSRYAVSLYFPLHKPGKKRLPAPIQRLAFYERTLLNEHVYPFLDAQEHDCSAPYSSLKHLAHALGIPVSHPVDINTTAFLEVLRSTRVDLGISIRCYQKFGAEIIDHFSRGGASLLWNLHPGRLPQYRGVMTCIRAMANGDEEHAYSLHVIDRNWDAGPIISMDSVRLDRAASMLDNMFTLYPTGMRILEKEIDRAGRGERIPTQSQDPDQAGYHSFPSESDLAHYEEAGLCLVNSDTARQHYLDAFSRPATPLRERLDALIRAQIVAQEQEVVI